MSGINGLEALNTEKSIMTFRKEIQDILSDIGEDTLSHDESEFWMLRSVYEYVEFYAMTKQLRNTAIALPLALGLHNGEHRKSPVIRDGVRYRVPYVIHPLLVCRMLIDMEVPIPREEEDVMLAAALCHDMIEDIPFPNHGTELITEYHLDPAVYETIRQVSKRRDFTEEEEQAFFRGIAENKLATLVKLSDRGNNVEDLYNMSVWKVHEYVSETNRFFVPMCDYAKLAYPDVRKSVGVLRDKIVSLTEAAQTLVDRYSRQEESLKAELESLRRENEALRAEWYRFWKD